MQLDQQQAEVQKLSLVRYLKPLVYLGAFFVVGYFFFAGPSVHKAEAKACTSALSGQDWTTSTTWTSANGCNVSGGPIAGDTVTIASGHTITISTAVAAASNVINNAGAASVNMTWTLDTSSAWAMGGIPLKYIANQGGGGGGSP